MHRDALDDVLAALTGVAPWRPKGRATTAIVEASRVGHRCDSPIGDRDEAHGVTMWHRWTHDSPAEAIEALATAGLWPWEIGDERAPRWWCERCDGTDDLTEECERFPCFSMSHPCLACDDGTNADPPTLAALVAVASLGRPMLQRITHTLAREIARAAGCPDARVVWRVMELEAIEEHHARTRIAWWTRSREYGGGIDPTLPDVFSTEEDISHWRSELRWRSRTMGRAAWPALRTLAVGDGETPQPTGVHLVGLDASRITLAIEAL